ncbi:DUF1315 family protein [uncultured Ferrimonas sp.]|uniref:YeaC family protein n=1 Tax=uncultured Ferrimonas sp. TaxID=432640 RepID=UPI00262D2FDC|nr:DUF1315 family protein [uncultured Ferrimonas sp.]
MDWQGMVDSLTPEMRERLQGGVETGKWPDGTRLSDKQRESAMQALIAWQAKYADNTDHLTVNKQGEINHLSKAQQKRQFDPNHIDAKVE